MTRKGIMRYTFETTYDQKALSIMAKCLRKTIRKKRSRKSHIFGWVVVLFALFLSFSSGEEGQIITPQAIATWIAVIVMVTALLFEDRINGYFARKRMLSGTEKAYSTFNTETPEVFISETAVGKSEFSYDRIFTIAETEHYFVFIFSTSHAQIYNKSTLSGGTVSEFRSFLREKTGKEIISIQ